MTDLRLTGDLGLWMGVLLGAVAAAVVWWWYRREVRHQPSFWARHVAPALRAAAAFLLVMMLTGPVLHHSRTIQQRGKVLVFVDGSESMQLADPQLTPERKLLIARRLGWLNESQLPTAAKEIEGGRVAQRIASGDASLAQAVAHVDQSSRRQRIERALFEGNDALLKSLVRKNDVLLFDLRNQTAEPLTGAGGVLPTALPQISPAPRSTDLGRPLAAEIERQCGAADAEGSPAAAVVLISDGQHNDGPTPLITARLLGQRGIPIYTIGVGALQAPQDIAVVGLDAPQTVFYDDLLRGHIMLDDNLPASQPCKIRIECDGKTVWQQELKTTGGGARRVPFDFSVRELAAERLRGAEEGLTIHALPLAMRVVIDPIAGEARRENNAWPLHVQAVTRQRKALLIDSRARWETRYLRNVLERDKRWVVQTILVGAAAEQGELRRGAGAFPQNQQQLNDYDLVILGDVPASQLQESEMKWLSEFVATRGGGMILLDGRDGSYDTFKNTPLAPLLPVQRVEDSGSTMVDSLSLTDDGLRYPALCLADKKGEDAALWSSLLPPHWLARVIAVPGAETLVEAVVDNRRWPACVRHRYGAGYVLYAAFDETWRWRFEVADRYHERFWKQISEWIMEKPFAVSDRFVQADVDQSAYQPGEKAAIRVRVRDDQGRPLPSAKVSAIVLRDGKPLSASALQSEEAATGLFRGSTEPLAAGQYEVRIRVEGVSDDQVKARVRFAVLPGETGELSALTLNENLLSAMASNSSGQYMREEQSGRLADLISPLGRERVLEDETPLWRSYWWFVPIMILLTAEWLLRKRAGLL